VKGEDATELSRRTINEKGARARSFIACNVGREKGNPHPTPMPVDLARYLVELGSWPGDTVLDPFGGSGNTGIAALALGRKYVHIEIEKRWAKLAVRRLAEGVK
jgi:site-specific DNA-methyltransferase (adenine-specific)